MENVKNWTTIVAGKDAGITALEQRQTELEMLVKFYEEQFKLAKHRQFGPSSEKGELPQQLGFFDEAENAADQEKPEPELKQITYARRKRKGKRKDDLSALPVEAVEHKLPEEDRICPECGGKLHAMGQKPAGNWRLSRHGSK